jgi:hypothetical protein
VGAIGAPVSTSETEEGTSDGYAVGPTVGDVTGTIVVTTGAMVLGATENELVHEREKKLARLEGAPEQ